ncbi:MAG: hypothetical protein JSR82_13855 [Verrucomicrobia bacterium]|nr:hypothetical protein [Verrucomicrobiota bacterium]
MKTISQSTLFRAGLLALVAVTALQLGACNTTNASTDRGGDAQANPVSTGAPEQTRKKAAPPGTGG